MFSLIGVSLWVLWLVGGTAVMVASALVFFGGFALVPLLGGSISVKAAEWNRRRDARVKHDASIIHNALSIKYAAIEGPAEARAAKLREIELAARTRSESCVSPPQVASLRSSATMIVCLWSNWIGDLLAIVGLVTCASFSAQLG